MILITYYHFSLSHQWLQSNVAYITSIQTDGDLVPLPPAGNNEVQFISRTLDVCANFMNTFHIYSILLAYVLSHT